MGSEANAKAAIVERNRKKSDAKKRNQQVPNRLPESRARRRAQRRGAATRPCRARARARAGAARRGGRGQRVGIWMPARSSDGRPGSGDGRGVVNRRPMGRP